jgi:RND family efflux transporter MFP subunit
VQANQAAVGSNLANEKRYGVLRSFEHVLAPFAGIITSRNIDVGSLVTPGQTSPTDASNATPTTGLFGIARVDTLRMYVDIPQSNYEFGKPGTPVKITVRELPKYAFSGTVHQSAGAVNENTRTVQTEIRIPNPGGLLLPGMYALADFSAARQKKLRVPATALIVDAKGTRVVVVDSDNKIHFRNIVLGRDYGTEQDVVNGLNVTDKLVSNPSDELQEGMVVKVAASGGKK